MTQSRPPMRKNAGPLPSELAATEVVPDSIVETFSILPPAAPPIRLEIFLMGLSHPFQFCAALKEVGWWPTDSKTGLNPDFYRRPMILPYVRPLADFMAYHFRNLGKSPSLQCPQHASFAHLVERSFWEAAIMHALVRCSVGKCRAINLVSAYASKEGGSHKMTTLFVSLPSAAGIV